MAALSSAAPRDFEEAIDRAFAGGLTKLHVVRGRESNERGPWTAVCQMRGGATTAVTHGVTYEDAVVRGLAELGLVGW